MELQGVLIPKIKAVSVMWKDWQHNDESGGISVLQAPLTALGIVAQYTNHGTSSDELLVDIFDYLKTLNKGYVITTDAITGKSEDYILAYTKATVDLVITGEQQILYSPVSMFNDILSYVKSLDTSVLTNYQYVIDTENTYFQYIDDILQDDENAGYLPFYTRDKKLSDITFPPVRVAQNLGIAHSEGYALPSAVNYLLTQDIKISSNMPEYIEDCIDVSWFNQTQDGYTGQNETDDFNSIFQEYVDNYNVYVATLPDVPEPPTESAIIGMVNAYNPTSAEMLDFAKWVWSTDVWTDKNDFKSPVNSILATRLIYVVPTTKENTEHLLVGTFDSQIPVKVCNAIFENVLCGQVYVEEKYNNVHDYTGVETTLYLPFIGYQTIDTALIMGKELSLAYRVNILNGDCMAYLYEVDTENSSKLEIATYSGNMGVSIPLNGSVSNMSDVDLNNPLAMLSHIPHIDVIRPVPYEPNDKNKYEGLPSNATVTLSSLTGYTKCKAVFIDGLTATNTEIETIKQLLESGVIL